MAKVDRLGWAAGSAFRTYGLSVGVRTTEAGALRRIVERLPPGSRPRRSAIVDQVYSLVVGGPGPRPGVRRLSIAYLGAQEIARTSELDQAIDGLVNHLTLYVAEFAPRRVFVHAGVVGWGGRAILVPGRSHSGKSRLVEALLRLGATYYSDEYAVIDEKGRVHPYTRPLSLRDEGTDRVREVGAGEIGAPSGVRPLPVAAVVVTFYRRGARWRPRTASRGEGVLALLANAVPARDRPQTVLPALSTAVRHAAVLRGARGEAEETASLLLSPRPRCRSRTARFRP